MRLSGIREKSREFPFEMLNMDFWCEYPKRDIEYVRWYPCRIERLGPEQLWATDEPADEPLAFYAHVPFCSNHCHSCFYRKYNTQGDLVRRYVDAFKREVEKYASTRHVHGAPFTSGYFGGGTPTALRARQLEELLTHLRAHLNVSPDAHITMETTPNEMDREKAELLVSLGVRRVSMGVQSFDDVLLRRIGRTHTGQKAMDVVDLLRKAGTRVINVDLMYGLPGETMESWRRTIDALLEAQVDSVSMYMFVVVPFGSLFARMIKGKEPPCPRQEEANALYNYAVEKLLSTGFLAVSPRDFVNGSIVRELPEGAVETYRLGDTSYRGIVPASSDLLRYPTHVWYHYREQIPLGSGAYGYVNGHTALNDPDVDGYIGRLERGEFATVMGTRVTSRERMAAAMVLGTKLLKMRREDFRRRFHVDMTEVYGEEIAKLERWGLVRMVEDTLEVTYPKGWYYTDNVSKTFFSEANRMLPQPAVDNVNVLKYVVPPADRPAAHP